MASESHPNENQVAFLMLLISQAEAGDKRFAGEITLFVEGLNQKCGHNKLESLGIQWKEALTYSQRNALSMDSELSAAFARFLHSRLVRHLSPTEEEINTLAIEHIRKCGTALRMGVQGLIRWRASMIDRASIFMPDTSAVTEGLNPVISNAADEFFTNHALGLSALKAPVLAEAVAG